MEMFLKSAVPPKKMFLNMTFCLNTAPTSFRYYVQPQWVFDCVNAQRLLPVKDYFPGEVLPPHLSPFVTETEGEYVPPEKQRMLSGETGVGTLVQAVSDFHFLVVWWPSWIRLSFHISL